MTTFFLAYPLPAFPDETRLWGIRARGVLRGSCQVPQVLLSLRQTLTANIGLTSI